jgi:glycosyltransferase involved in cell wall biosynthesis
MHVGLLIYGDLETVSGGYLYDRMLVDHLRRSGDRVEIISLPWRSYPRHLFDNLSPTIHRRLLDFRGDLLLQDELNHPSLFWVNRRLKLRLRYPLLTIVHHLRSQEQRPAWQNRIYRFIERSYLQTVAGFIFNSLTTRQTVSDLGLPLDQVPSIVALPAGDQFDPGVTAEHIRLRAVEPGPLRVIFLGSLIPRKGLHTLLQALASLPEGLLTLTVVGSAEVDPAYARRIERQVSRLGLADRVQLRGSLSKPDLAAALRRHHVLAVPSSYEGYGIVYLEAMGFGLPALATTSGAAREIITPGQDGFLVPPGDPVALAHRLAQLARDRDLLAEMGCRALHRFYSQPTWSDTASHIRDFMLSFFP